MKTLLKAGLLKEEEAQRLIEGLEAIKKEILEGSFEFKEVKYGMLMMVLCDSGLCAHRPDAKAF